ncbi:MAG: hypothetical protein IJR07_11375 [Bacteroidaceae bacterium]|nr:hypothetical protein [Bacteroidaceae bacterium]
MAKMLVMYSGICYGLSQYLLRVVPKLPMSHRSISYGGMADTATGDGSYCGQWWEAFLLPVVSFSPARRRRPLLP